VGWIGGGADNWQTGAAPVSNSDYQSFSFAYGVFVDSNQVIYVTDGNNRVSKWTD
jgi:hypothetical protein